MSESTFSPPDAPDPVEELRLRRWARRNYVPAERRAGQWHPVVLDEMCAKDRELSARDLAGPRDGERVETSLLGMIAEIELREPEPPARRACESGPARQDRQARPAGPAGPASELSENQRICSQYVPLVPMHFHVHSAHEAPAEPNLANAPAPATVEWLL